MWANFQCSKHYDDVCMNPLPPEKPVIMSRSSWVSSNVVKPSGILQLSTERGLLALPHDLLVHCYCLGRLKPLVGNKHTTYIQFHQGVFPNIQIRQYRGLRAYRHIASQTLNYDRLSRIHITDKPASCGSPSRVLLEYGSLWPWAHGSDRSSFQRGRSPSNKLKPGVEQYRESPRFS